jgi:mannose-6-phosphate isomerase
VAVERCAPETELAVWAGSLLRAWGFPAPGAVRYAAPTQVPLVVKLLDVGDRLSIQVHPNDAHARAAAVGERGKSEVWVVLEAREGAEIACGLAAPLSREALVEAARDGSLGGRLAWTPARVGDVHVLPAGTVHAAKGPVLLYEVQTPCDTTWRLDDWGRGRTLDVERGARAATLEPVEVAAPPMSLDDGGVCVARTDWCRVDAREAPARWSSSQHELATVVAGEVALDGVSLARGATVALTPGTRTLVGAGRVLVTSLPR